MTDLDEVRRLVAAAGATWIADETPVVGRLAAGGDANAFGLNMTPQEADVARRRADYAHRNFQAVPLPLRHDWRSHSGSNWLNPIRDQGACGACVAFATTAVLEARIRIADNDPTLDLTLSTSHLFFCGAGHACRQGWNFDAALRHLRDQGGVGLESGFPYRPQNQACRQTPAVARVLAWDTCNAATARKQAIVTGGPVIAGMRVFEDFAYYRSGVYRQVTGEFQGLHAVAVVGYSDPDQYWIVRNSWGDGWGDAGYGLIGYGQCGIDSEFLFYDPQVDYQPAGFDEDASSD